jgi:hypothetical protein
MTVCAASGMLPCHDAAVWYVQSACAGCQVAVTDEEKRHSAQRYHVWLL